MADPQEREGGDITASDMILPEDDSEILEFYKDSTIFITGATGFIGKLCMEKLLRTCPNLNKIYILIRPKKGKDSDKRFDEIFNEVSFEPLKRKNPSFRQKVHVINGDVALPELGISKEDREKLIAEVDCVFHFAATVRFDEKLKLATHINVRGVREILRLGRQMKKLRALLHISTAYSNCVRKEIYEEFYDSPMSGEKLINLVECLDDEKLEAITPTILGDFPNTYAFTKCVAEDVLRTEGKNMPVALYRPSIVIGTAKEPVSGWIDNLYGASGILIGVAMGLIRTMPGKKENKADMVPADYVVNSCLAVNWDVATMKSLNDNKETQDQHSREEKFEKEIPVYNYVCSPERPMTWEYFEYLSEKHCKAIPSEKVLWHKVLWMIPNPYLFLAVKFFLHTLPAYIVDFIAICLGRKPMLVKGYQKINKFVDVIGYFALKEWHFKNDNTQALWRRLKRQDKELFEFSMERLNWDMYFYTYSRGARVYLLKDPLDTIDKGQIKYYKVMFAHYVLVTLLTLALLKFTMVLFSFIFRV